MPIEIRPSDVIAEAASAVSKWAGFAEKVSKTLYEKDRVKQFNEWKVRDSLVQQKQLEDYQKRQIVFEAPAPVEEGERAMGAEAVLSAAPPIIKTLGEADLSDVMADFDRSIAAREADIR